MGKSAQPVQVIPIDLAGRYILILNTPPDAHTDHVREVIEYMQEGLDEWWKSDRPYIILATFGGLEVKVERVENG